MEGERDLKLIEERLEYDLAKINIIACYPFLVDPSVLLNYDFAYTRLIATERRPNKRRKEYVIMKIKSRIQLNEELLVSFWHKKFGHTKDQYYVYRTLGAVLGHIKQ